MTPTAPQPARRVREAPDTKTTAPTAPAVMMSVPRLGCSRSRTAMAPKASSTGRRTRGSSRRASRWLSSANQRARPDDHGQLGQLGGLDAQRAGAQPAGGAVGPDPDARDEDQRQEHEADHQEGRGQPSPEPVVLVHHDEHPDDTDQGEDGLAGEAVPRRSRGPEVADRRRGHHHDQAEQHQRRHHHEQADEGRGPVARRPLGPGPGRGMPTPGRAGVMGGPPAARYRRVGGAATTRLGARGGAHGWAASRSRWMRTSRAKSSPRSP